MGDITVIRYNCNYSVLWNSFVSKAKNGIFLFDRNFMDYHSDRFTDHSLLFLDGEDVVAVLPACEEKESLISHGGLTYGGLLMDCSIKQHTVNDCFNALMNYLQKQSFKKLLYKPVPHMFHQQPAEEDLYALQRNGAKLVEVSASTVLNLKEPLKLSKGRKAQISRAKREGVEVKILKEKDDYIRFIDLENEVLETRHGVHAVHTADELFMLHSSFPSTIHLYGATKDTKLVAGTVVFEYNNAVHTQYMGSSEQGRTVGALDLTVATIVNDYKGTKTWLDFGISTENRGKVLNEGLISQKESFGGRTNVYMAWELNIED